jgi:uncharacterized protein YndB with AHSA1/START domain
MEVVRELVLPAPADEIWEALTDPERLAQWFANDVDLDPRPGGQGVFRWANGETRTALVEELDPPHRFGFRWGGEDGETDVLFELEEVPEGTRLVVRETTGPEAYAGEWSTALELRLLRPLLPTA